MSLRKYIVAVTAFGLGGGGRTGERRRIDPSGLISADDGESLSFNFVPEREYEAAQLILNGFPIGTRESYTFNDVHGNHTISGTFKRK